MPVSNHKPFENLSHCRMVGQWRSRLRETPERRVYFRCAECFYQCAAQLQLDEAVRVWNGMRG